MGRTPDFKAALMGSLASEPEFYAPFDESARKWYKRYSSQCLFLNHCLINPPILTAAAPCTKSATFSCTS